jgi:hypothetical protein
MIIAKCSSLLHHPNLYNACEIPAKNATKHLVYTDGLHCNSFTLEK